MSNVDPLFVTAPEIEAALVAIKDGLAVLAPGQVDLTDVDRRLDALEQFADALKAAVAGLPDVQARLDALEAKPFLLNG